MSLGKYANKLEGINWQSRKKSIASRNNLLALTIGLHTHILMSYRVEMTVKDIRCVPEIMHNFVI